MSDVRTEPAGMRTRGVLYHKVRSAYDYYTQTGDLQGFALRIARAGDVRYMTHFNIVCRWIEEIIPGNGRRTNE
jgi:hypothetical protein